MDVLDLHQKTVERYQEYIRSFIDIRDQDIEKEVTEQLSSGKLWPEPLIQFNPDYATGDPLKSLVTQGVLDAEVENVFSGYQLY